MLREKAVLVIEGTETGAFEFEEVSRRPRTEKQMLLGGDRGQLLDEFLDLFGIGGGGADASGYTVDAGLGSNVWELEVELSAADDAERWGTVTDEFDPVGAVEAEEPTAHGEHPATRAEVLQYWIRRNRADSIRDNAKLFTGEWSTDEFSGPESGKFDDPISVAPQSVSFQDEVSDPDEVTLSLELLRTEPFPDTSSVFPTL